LRRLLRTASERAPWYRQRLADVDPDTATEADLARIAPMSKGDLMANFDDILTDRRLSLAVAEDHLAGLTDDAYLLDAFHVVASGGSSGTRGVFAYGWEGWAILALLMMRVRLRHQLADPQIGPTALRATVAAGKATHISYAVPRTFRDIANATAISAALPLKEIVHHLNEMQPVILTGYPSMLYALANEALAGRLEIAPRMVAPNSEPLLPEMRSAIEGAWHSPILNAWGASEGVFAGACGQGRGMHLSEDVAIFEFVDNEGRPVPPGVRAAKMYVTNLYNQVQPLIRYEITDETILIDEPCPCGSAMRRIADIEGRSDDLFTYGGGLVVHPLTFRSRLGHERDVVEYQVTQTQRGAAVVLRTQGPVDAPSLARDLEGELLRLGLPQPHVTVEIVDGFDRQTTGKLKRFFPVA
jgi:phenylacetate-CoA ligase